MKRLAAGAIILVQLWLLSPVCCCWFKAAAQATGGDCCCSQPDPGTPGQTPASSAKDCTCRCGASKVQLPLQMTVAVGDTSRQVRPVEQLIPALTQPASLVVLDQAGPLDFRDSPPVLAGADWLYELHRLNL